MRIWFDTFFLTAGITLLSKYILNLDIGNRDMLKAFLPISGHALWFPAAYIGLLLLSPILNVIISKQKMCQYAVVTLFCMFSLITTFIPANGGPYCSSDFVWFNFVYLYIGYIKKYAKIDRNIAGIIGATTYILLILWRVICELLDTRYSFLVSLETYYLSELETIPNLLCASGIFLFVESKDIKPSKWINELASSAFTVYIIHQTPVFYQYLWDNVFKIESRSKNSLFLIYYVAIVLGIYVFGYLVDMIRKYVEKKFFKLSCVRYVCNWMDNKVNDLE